MEKRIAEVHRKTGETDISMRFCLDGSGKADLSTGIGFFDHMMDAFTRHGLFDMKLKAEGDLHVDGHHTVEDTGIVLGQAIREAVGDKKGIRRYGFFILPMDEALVLTAVDLSGRSVLCFDLDIPAEKVGSFDTELVEEFFTALCANAGLTLHVRKLAGRNSHHIIEGCFKSFARSLRKAVAIDPAFADEVPSTKGVLA